MGACACTGAGYANSCHDRDRSYTDRARPRADSQPGASPAPGLRTVNVVFKKCGFSGLLAACGCSPIYVLVPPAVARPTTNAYPLVNCRGHFVSILHSFSGGRDNG